eukprot:6280334-Prymnesium_polylepis.1
MACWRVCPPTSAESRTARPPQVQPIAPIVPIGGPKHDRRRAARARAAPPTAARTPGGTSWW